MKCGSSAAECWTKNRKSPGPKTKEKNTNSTQNKSESQSTRAYKVTSFLSTDCELAPIHARDFIIVLGPMFESPLFYRFKTCAFSFSPSCPSSPSCINKYLAIDNIYCKCCMVEWLPERSNWCRNEQLPGSEALWAVQRTGYSSWNIKTYHYFYEIYWKSISWNSAVLQYILYHAWW